MAGSPNRSRVVHARAHTGNRSSPPLAIFCPRVVSDGERPVEVMASSSSNAASERVPKRVAIIGAGPVGLGTLKVLADAPQVKSGLWTVKVFEERDDIGGIWLPAPPTGNPPPTALYDSLYTNLPHPIMGYASFPFPPGIALYPSAKEVKQYLKDYTDHFELWRFITFNTRVEEARWSSEANAWKVRLSGSEQPQDFDFIVVANGHYRKPRYPDTPGIQKWLEEGRAIHSAWYRRPSDHAQHKTVLVVGSGPSALDISAELRTVAQSVIHSISPGPVLPGNFAPPPDTEGYRKVGKVAEYKDNGELILQDGTTISDVDFVVLGTGYDVDVPFLPQVVDGLPPRVPPLPEHLYNSGSHIFPLAKHLFPLQADFPPTAAAFPGLPIRASPLALSEDQSRAIIRVLEAPEALDVEAENASVLARAKQLAEQVGTDDPLRIAQEWFVFEVLEPFDYRKELLEFAEPGTVWKAPKWEVLLWERKIELRGEWRDIVKAGLAEEWAKGVGKDGLQEWVDLSNRVLRRYDEKKR